VSEVIVTVFDNTTSTFPVEVAESAGSPGNVGPITFDETNGDSYSAEGHLLGDKGQIKGSLQQAGVAGIVASCT
jgi:hypothetical protein